MSCFLDSGGTHPTGMISCCYRRAAVRVVFSIRVVPNLLKCFLVFVEEQLYELFSRFGWYASYLNAFLF